MTCYVTVSVISESVTGDIGDDWEYKISGASVGDDGLPQVGHVNMPEHEIEPDASPKPPPEAKGFTVNAGECGGATQVTLTVTAKEVDWLIPDTAPPNVVTITINCPGPGAPRVTQVKDVTLTVKEKPGFLGGRAQLHLKLSIVAECK